MAGSYLAHSANTAGATHGLAQHLIAVANRAAEFAAKFGASELARLGGLWHDLGKYLDCFQEYMADPRPGGGPDHSTVGAMVAAWHLELLAFVVAGHHAGLPSADELKVRIGDEDRTASCEEALRRAEQDLGRIRPEASLGDLLPGFLSRAGNGDVRRHAELFIRMLLSALTDADFLDTEAHFHPEQAARRTGYPDLAELWARFEADQAGLTRSSDGLVNQIRNEVYRACLKSAAFPQGIFSLTVPTGGGKTRSAMGFALQHALEHGADRVIVAIPYTSIVEQTVDVYREIFGTEAVLEHHSAIAEEGDDRSRLASENWDAPIIVTTTVQLFESLLANRPSCCRKLHNIAQSVVILDEVQTLPERLLEPILDVIQDLADHYGTTVVLCSATQPALEGGPYVRGLRGVKEIIPNPAQHFAALKRVHYDVHLDGWSWEQVADEMRGSEQCLAVVNTKDDALALLETLNDDRALHLSTSLCGAHRRDVLAEVRRRIASREPCHLVSTQVVEAGVDLDFPLVLRATGPLDRIVQAGGRCNREGRLTEGRVVVFEPAAGHLPLGAYETATSTARNLLSRPDSDLHDPALTREYFLRLYQAVELDADGIQAERERFNYPQVAARFRLIKDDRAPVVVCYRPHGGNAREVPALLNSIRRRGALTRWDLRVLQAYMVGVRSGLVPGLEQQGLIAPVSGGLWEWRGGYHEVRGLDTQGHRPDDLVV